VYCDGSQQIPTCSSRLLANPVVSLVRKVDLTLTEINWAPCRDDVRGSGDAAQPSLVPEVDGAH
jgi:hypothetical protein